jgi:hypothetical protein
MMFSSSACRFVLFSILSLSANADTDTIRGVHRELEQTVILGDAGDFSILAKTAITTGAGTSINGNIGVSPIAATAMTGFAFTKGADLLLSQSTLITGGQAYAPWPLYSTKMTTAVSDMETAYTNAKGRDDSAQLNLNGGLLAGLTLVPGLYKFGSDVSIASDKLTFKGGPSDIWIIQMTGNLIQAANTNIVLESSSTDPTQKPVWENIFWQVEGLVEVGQGAHMKGTLLVKTKVALISGASLKGRVLTQTACNLGTNVVIDSTA